ncbi:nucleoside 2-deoxyribosyltransferase [Amantichitinum ursilacus]|uniref:Nucleoside 2-deoxyribosyltransferase n=1 Tax=Amantichitinum ursilacus TaxID=857265 RepID=A0A0N1JSH2_9NEIS|nr:nucleoside 2-deoxyribosyltransferase [Amantichitinum ursilacus]KPC52153.1 Nucleoside 2-deoxyribosyltransferase [Amantichitinum ursilacus]
MPAITRIYLAGPGVFRPDAVVWGARLKAACEWHGLQGLYPLDAAVPPFDGDAEKRRWIFRQNCGLIARADAVFADVRAFRSESEPDSGTAFEIGAAFALGKPVWLWLPGVSRLTPMHGRIQNAQHFGHWVDAQGNVIEDFGAPLNLMLWEAAESVITDAEPEDAIQTLAREVRVHR